jgi:hypothetical protein
MALLRGALLLDALLDFGAMDRHLRRRVDPKLNSAALDANDRHFDVVRDT